MLPITISLENVTRFSGLPLSVFLIWRLHKKSNQRGTICNKFPSNDACMYYQLWTHAVGNFLLTMLALPVVDENLPCYMKKVPYMSLGAVVFLTHLPSILDCAVRTNDTPFYQQFHSIRNVKTPIPSVKHLETLAKNHKKFLKPLLRILTKFLSRAPISSTIWQDLAINFKGKA